MQLPFNGDYPITREFGIYDAEAYARYPGYKHPGVDLGIPVNTPLFAAQSGTCNIADPPTTLRVGRGKEVSILNNGIKVNTCHMNEIHVKSGQWVEEGQQIGLSGNTGFVLPVPSAKSPNSGQHLHLEVVVDGQYVDPIKYIKEHSMTLTAAETDEFISQVYQKIAGRPPAANEFDFHRENFASQGSVWALRMVEGFKGDDIAWKKYERNLQDAGKLLKDNPDAKTLAKIKELLGKGV